MSGAQSEVGEGGVGGNEGETKIKQRSLNFMVFSRPKEILSADTLPSVRQMSFNEVTGQRQFPNQVGGGFLV